MAPREGGGGLGRVLAREVRRTLASPLQVTLMAVLPVVTSGWLLTVFREPTPRDLPVAMLDLDRSTTARALARAVDATPSVRIAADVESLDDGRRLVQRGRVYAVVVIPQNVERDLARGTPVHFTAFYNAQLLLASSIVARDLQAVGLLASAGAKARRLAAGGTPMASLAARVEPVVARTHLLYNPELDYRYYLFAALLPAMLQMFVAMTTVVAFGRELKEGTAASWIAAAGGRRSVAVLGKVLVLVCWFVFVGLAMLATIFGIVGAPLRGSVPALVAALVLFVAAYTGISILFVALVANLRLAGSLVAFYTGIAFAFMGVTFPMLALPGVARVWADLLPVTHFVRVLFEQSVRGGGLDQSAGALIVLMAFAVVPMAIAALPLAHLLDGRRRWSSL